MKARPFIKWAGGKGNLLAQLEQLLPANFSDLDEVTYIEPFVGGGAMLFHMLQEHPNITRAVINDINADLIHCYELVRDNPEKLISLLRDLDNTYNNVNEIGRRKFYYDCRKIYNSPNVDFDERAAYLIFLNHTCYNGLYRVNNAGKFNVPHGRYKHPIICNEELIMENHRLLTGVELVIRQPGDYNLVSRNLRPHHTNFVYLDPPYRPLTTTSYFKEYSNAPFGDQQQEELKVFCDRLTRRGCLLMQSNSDSMDWDGSSYFEHLYQGYNITRVLAPRFINAVARKRTKLEEIVIRNYGYE